MRDPTERICVALGIEPWGFLIVGVRLCSTRGRDCVPEYKTDET